MSYLKRGAEAAKMFDKQEHEAKSKVDKLWRFYLKEGTEARITFVDGNLDKNGLLDAVTLREHTIKNVGSFPSFFVCVGEEEPCPLCMDGQKPSLISALTVIDHRKYVSKSGNVTLPYMKKLFIYTPTTRKLLQSIAAKRGGLAGITFDVSRPEDNRSPRVGSMFDFVDKKDATELKKQFTYKTEDGKVKTLFTPADYEKEMPWISADELRKLGFGGGKTIGKEPHHAEDDDSPALDDDDDGSYDKDL